MKVHLKSFRVPLARKARPLKDLVAVELEVSTRSIAELKVLRESVDARKKFSPALVYNLELELDIAPRQLERLLKNNPNLSKAPLKAERKLATGSILLNSPPVVVGAGPAGYFAALTLAQYGFKPLLLERGDDVDTRSRRVAEFWQGGELDPESNVQFGEGGAGTFSDGKLTTRIDDWRISHVLGTLIANGAPSEIGFKHKPHVGTDNLKTVVKGLRRQLEAAGGEVRFRCKLTALRLEQGSMAGVQVNNNEEISAQVVVLAIGHSARDTYAMLENSGVSMEPKAFAVGLRVEHPQELIDEAQYGKYASDSRLGAADYQLTFQDAELGRAAYAFCMCPGGKVVAAASEPGQVATNGMSEFARDTGRANSALVVTVNPDDYKGNGKLAGVEFQRNWERQAFRLGGGGYKAPVQSVRDFLADKVGGVELDPSYLPGVREANLLDALPKEVGEVLGRAINSFEQKISGFATGPATLTGVETRTSAPLRIMRGQEMESVSTAGLYPSGEGAGYAGGIMSAAVDGIKVAEAIISKFAPLERRQ